jgi:hypothetical protein
VYRCSVMKIRELRCVQVSGRAEVEAPEERQLHMLDIYPELARRGPGAGGARVTGTYVELEADDGTTGLFGPIFDETAPIIPAWASSWTPSASIRGGPFQPEAVVTSCRTPSSWRTILAPCASACSFIRAIGRARGFMPQSVVRYTRSGGTTAMTARIRSATC